MAHYARREVSYSALDNESSPPLGVLGENANVARTMITLDQEHEDTTNVHIIHKVPKNKGTHLTKEVCHANIFVLHPFILRIDKSYVVGTKFISSRLMNDFAISSLL